MKGKEVGESQYDSAWAGNPLQGRRGRDDRRATKSNVCAWFAWDGHHAGGVKAGPTRAKPERG